ncbi:MAG TPA: glycosyltransferase family 4 protein [Gemmataceae bacterium]|jgi:glycosyltransferase involved in cell wall biosynthesis|nr:glycosyltransferase family 4 protein [Gemmataceae bacterium]
MKIAWFTPFCRQSAIGRFSQTVTAELARHAAVDIWTPHKPPAANAQEGELHATALKVFPLASLHNNPELLASYDHVVYNLGDCWAYHGEIFETLEQTPGRSRKRQTGPSRKQQTTIVVLHDYVMHHFFQGLYLIHRKDSDGYLQKVQTLYGPAARQEMAEGLAGGSSVDVSRRAINFPFFEPCLTHATAAVTLSSFFADIVRAQALCPVARLYLPHNLYDRPVPLEAAKTALGVPHDKLLLLSVGHVNPNKRIDAVLEVLGRDAELAAKVQYIVIGCLAHTAYREKLEQLIRDYRLGNVVRLLGQQSDEVLYQHLSSADLCINLRNPAMEGASASLVEALTFGRPLLVSDTGSYQEVPDGCVLKVPLRDEVPCLHKLLKDLVGDRARRQALGRQGREYVLKHHSPVSFARDFLEFIRTLDIVKPQFDLLDRVSHELAAMDVRAGTELVQKISREIDAFWPRGRDCA